MRRRLIGSLATMLVLGIVAVPMSSRATPPSIFFAGMHNHTGYSDGVPGTTPTNAYAVAQASGLDVMTTSEHSEGFDVPMTLSDQCLPTSNGTLVECALADGANSFRKWDANLEQANAATDPGSFVGIRGFEWTSDVEDHINVYLSSKYTNAKIDGGYATMATFWKWALDNEDALITFNHPGDKTNVNTGGLQIAPGPFDNFKYVPAADRHVFGIEVFNGGKTKDYTKGKGNINYIARALDAGWHVGLIGSQDTHTDDWGDAVKWPRTGFITDTLDRDHIRDAMLARNFYATTDANLRLSFKADGEEMGARLRRPAGQTVALHVEATDPDGETISKIELMTNTGAIVGTALNSNSADFTVASTAGERWYLARITQVDNEKAYTSPVWIGASTHPYGEWMSGDLHIHTQNGHDTCKGDNPTTRFDGTLCDEPWTWSFSPAERIQLAKERGMDFIAITDHGNVFSQSDPAVITEEELTLIPAYENSLPGHAQMLGATHCFGGSHIEIGITYCDNPNVSPAGVGAQMAALRGEGGVFQINHPGDYRWWNKYGPTASASSGYPNTYLDLAPDSIEVWNIGPWEYQAPLPAASENDFAITFWEKYLNAGLRVTATGGSDSHWRSTSAVQGVGQPTTWVYSAGKDHQDVLEGIRSGYTNISPEPPAFAGQRLFLEADADGNGSFESWPGDTVPAGSKFRARVEQAPPGAFVRLIGKGGLVQDLPVGPDGTTASTMMGGRGAWVRAELLVEDTRNARGACEPYLGGQTSYCRNRILVLGMSSALYQA